MSKLIKLGTSVGLSVASLGLMATSAFAANNTIFNTGNNFHFNGSTTTNTTVHVNNNNSADIGQSAFTFAGTGGNTSNQNILGGGVMTGNASVANFFSVNANANWTSISL